MLRILPATRDLTSVPVVLKRRDPNYSYHTSSTITLRHDRARKPLEMAIAAAGVYCISKIRKHTRKSFLVCLRIGEYAKEICIYRLISIRSIAFRNSPTV